MAASTALTPLSWAALLPLPAALDALVTGFAFLLLARLTLERSAQAGGLPLLLGHVVVPYLRLRHLCRSPRRSLRRWPRRGCAGARPDVRRAGCRPAARRFSALLPPHAGSTIESRRPRLICHGDPEINFSRRLPCKAPNHLGVLRVVRDQLRSRA